MDIVFVSRRQYLAGFSNYVNCVDYYAPSSVRSMSLGGYTDFGGTFSSAAIVSGIIGQLRVCGVARSLSQSHLVEHIKSVRSLLKGRAKEISKGHY